MPQVAASKTCPVRPPTAVAANPRAKPPWLKLLATGPPAPPVALPVKVGLLLVIGGKLLLAAVELVQLAARVARRASLGRPPARARHAAVGIPARCLRPSRRAGRVDQLASRSVDKWRTPIARTRPCGWGRPHRNQEARRPRCVGSVGKEELPLLPPYSTELHGDR